MIDSLIAVTAAMLITQEISDTNLMNVDPEVMAQGKEIYYRPGSCAGCHGDNGEGSTYIPPLANENRFTKSKKMLTQIVWYGFEGYIRVNANGYDGDMPAQQGMMSTAELAALLTFVRNSFGNKHGSLREKDVLKVIESVGEREEPYQLDELLGRKKGATPTFNYKPETLLQPAGGKAMLFRHHVEGSSARTISVGFSEDLNYAFDSDGMNISLIWKGDFINAGRHWANRSKGWTKPKGTDVVALKARPPFAVKPGKGKWPELNAGMAEDFRFLGFELDAQDRPTFRYEWNGISISDFTAPDGDGLSRTITLSADSKPRGIKYFAAEGAKVKKSGKGWRVDDALTTNVSLNVNRRSFGEGYQLIVPVKFRKSGDKWVATITQTYKW